MLPVYAIVNENGEYSSGSIRPNFHKNRGKVWTARNHVKSHLRVYMEAHTLLIAQWYSEGKLPSAYVDSRGAIHADIDECMDMLYVAAGWQVEDREGNLTPVGEFYREENTEHKSLSVYPPGRRP